MKAKWSHGLVLAPILMACVTSGCAPLVPSVLPIEGTRRAAVGSTSVGGALVYAGDYVRLPAAGGFARVSHQLTDTFSLGGDLGMGGGSTSTSISTTNYFTVTGRFHGSYTPNNDHIALQAGISGAAGNAGGGMSIDIGGRFGFAPHPKVDLWAGQSIGYSLAFASIMGRLQSGSFFLWATSIGVGFHVTPTITVGPSLTMAFVADSNGGHPSDGSGFRPGFVPGLYIQSATNR